MIARRREYDLIDRERIAKYKLMSCQLKEADRKVAVLSGYTMDAPAVSHTHLQYRQLT